MIHLRDLLTGEIEEYKTIKEICERFNLPTECLQDSRILHTTINGRYYIQYIKERKDIK